MIKLNQGTCFKRTILFGILMISIFVFASTARITAAQLIALANGGDFLSSDNEAAETIAADSIAVAVDAEKLGFDSSKLDKIELEMESQIQAGKIVGCSALILKDNKVAYSRVFGQRDQKQNVPVEFDTIWRIYSMSKPITSVAVMQLAENGRIKLDEPASTYLPEFKELRVFKSGRGDAADATVECKNQMTVRDLLRHTSGLTYGFFGNSKVDQAYRRSTVLITDERIENTITKLSKIPLLHQPGTKWHYSVSTDVLGRIVEVASGMTFREYLQKHIFDPLEMKDTFFTVPKAKQNRFAEMYRFDGGKLVPVGIATSFRFLAEDNAFYSGGGGLCSTTRDYVRFAQMLLEEGELDGKRLLKKLSIKEMTKNQLPKGAGKPGFKFGLGFRIDNQGHYFWGGAAGTRFWIDPKNKMITVFMIQINPYQGGHGERFKELAYEALRK